MAGKAFPVLSPDGRTVALCEERGGISLYGTGSQPLALKGVTEYAIRFTSDGKSLLVAEPTGRELVLTLVDLSSGHREPWRRVPSALETRDQSYLLLPSSLAELCRTGALTGKSDHEYGRDASAYDRRC